MTAALNLYKRHDQVALLRMRERIEADPANRDQTNGIHLYLPKARRKLSDIAEAITMHMADRRAEEGRRVATDGYSGRKQNRR